MQSNSVFSVSSVVKSDERNTEFAEEHRVRKGYPVRGIFEKSCIAVRKFCGSMNQRVIQVTSFGGRICYKRAVERGRTSNVPEVKQLKS